jgi:hypothetical protein
MKNNNDFRDLLIEPEVDSIMEKVQQILKDDYDNDEHDSDEDIWENNNVEVNNLPRLFMDLQRGGIMPTDLSLHYTQNSDEASYEEMNSRFILMDSLKPIYVTWFNDVILVNNGFYEGLKKDGFRKIIKAALFYHQYQREVL